MKAGDYVTWTDKRGQTHTGQLERVRMMRTGFVAAFVREGERTRTVAVTKIRRLA